MWWRGSAPQEEKTSERLLGHRWLLIDVETSGLRPYADRVLSVAAVAIDENGRTEGEFATLINPGCDPGPVHIHGLTRERLAGQPVFQDVLPALLAISHDRVLVAHNASFDHDFLEHEAVRTGAQLPVKHRLCTVALTRRLGLPVPDHRLPTLAAHWDIRQDRHHDAIDDVRVLQQIFHRSTDLAARLGLPLPIVDCTRRPRPAPFPAAVTKTPCPFRYAGPWRAGNPLTQGMKIAITGPTTQARERIIDRCVRAGLDVTSTVSSVTSLLVCNDPAQLETGKIVAARTHGTPVVDEHTLTQLLADTRPGARKDAPRTAPTTPATTRKGNPKPTGPFAGRRVLVLGGPHETAAHARTRLTALGAAAPVNLTASVTDVVLLDGGADDHRAAKAQARDLRLLTWPDLQTTSWDARSLNHGIDAEPIPRRPADRPIQDVDAAAAAGVAAPSPLVPVDQQPVVLTRGAAMDLPGDAVWTLNVSWQAVTAAPDRDVDVVAFVVDHSEHVTTDADFVFYNQPISEDGAVQLAENGSNEQSIRLDLSALPTWCTRVEIAAAITGTGTFADVGAIVVDADAGDDLTGTSRPIATATLDAATTERTMLLATVYRRGDIWRLRAIGQGYDTDLAHLARSFGVAIDS